MKVWLLSVAVLLSIFGKADALKEPEICYVLDAILFVYGIVLTVLYCHLKLKMRRQEQKLKSGPQVYETIMDPGQARRSARKPLNQTDKQIYSEIPAMAMQSKQEPRKAGESVYTGLQSRSQETYETLQMQEKPN